MKTARHFNWKARIASYRVTRKPGYCAKCQTHYDILVRVGFAGWVYYNVCARCFEVLSAGRTFDALGAEVAVSPTQL